VIVRCRVGRRQGVSSAAVPFYDELVDRFGDQQVRVFAEILSKPEVAGRLDDTEHASQALHLVLKYT
jgi:hypothetical protein